MARPKRKSLKPKASAPRKARRAKKPRPSRGAAHSEPREVARLSHELQVHQEELETQNRHLVESQRLLEDSRDRYASLYDFAPAAYVTFDGNGVIREINLTGAVLLGQTRERFIETPFVLLLAPQYRRSFMGHLTRCRSGLSLVSSEVVVQRRDGTLFPAELRTNGLPVRGPEGPLYLSVLLDLSERQRLDRERDRLRETSRSEELLRTILRSLPVSVRVVSASGESLISNEACRAVWGLSPEAPLPMWDHQKGFDLQHRRLTQQDWPVAQALSPGGGSVLRQVIRVQGLDGTVRSVMQSAIPLLNGKGEITGAVEVTEDLTRLFSAQEAARLRQDQLEAAFDAAHLSFWDWNLRTHRLTWSGPFEQVFNSVPGNASNRVNDFLHCVHPDDAAALSDSVANARERRTALETEFRIQLPDGEVRWVLAKGRFRYNDLNQPIRMTGVLTDVTDRKSAELQLVRAKEAAERASRVKDDFLATVSHELRTPLSAIILWTHLVRSTLAGDREKSDALDTILQSAKSLSQLVDDLLDISRSVAGKLRLNLGAASLGDAVLAAMESVRPSAEIRQITLTSSIEKNLPLLRIDPDRIGQVAWNLLSNAIKFTPPGGTVKVEVSRQQSADGAVARLTVSDTGQGIAPELMPHIFDRFRQGETGATRGFSGLGLGLAIARELVQMHGGTIRADSAGKDRGSTFIVELPVPVKSIEASPAQAAPHASQAHAESLKGLNVLLVEDDDDTRAALDRVLEAAGASVRSAPSARQAVEAFRKEKPDVLVSDIAMPEEDGYTMMRRLRRIESETNSHGHNGNRKKNHEPHIPALALTAHALPGDRDKAIEAGFQAHLAKPVDPRQLISAVAALCQTS